MKNNERPFNLLFYLSKIMNMSYKNKASNIGEVFQFQSGVECGGGECCLSITCLI